MCRHLYFFFFCPYSSQNTAKQIGSLSVDKLWSFILSPVQIIWESTGVSRRGNALKEPLVSCWYPLPRTEKGTLTLSHLDGNSRNFIWCKVAKISVLFLHHRALSCVLSFHVLLFLSVPEVRGKLQLWRGLFHTYLQGRIGGWDTVKTSSPSFPSEGGYYTSYILGRLISFSKHSTLKQRGIHSLRM